MIRSSLISRIIAGTLGAYAATVLATIALSRLIIVLGGDPVEATLGATLSSFALFAVIAITVFHAPKPLGPGSGWRSLPWVLGCLRPSFLHRLRAYGTMPRLIGLRCARGDVSPQFTPC